MLEGTGKEERVDKPKPIQPVTVEIKTALVPEKPLARGMVRLIALDANGQEIGNTFDIAERALKHKIYGDPTQFKVKKKVKI